MTRPCVLFVCVKNAGKSQMAAALMSAVAGDDVGVHSAGTVPGTALNEESIGSLAAIGVAPAGERPQPIDPALLAAADRVVVIGAEAVLPDLPSGPVERWLTDEPSARGITGAERMDLIRDELRARVDDLLVRLRAEPPRG